MVNPMAAKDIKFNHSSLKNNFPGRYICDHFLIFPNGSVNLVPTKLVVYSLIVL